MRCLPSWLLAGVMVLGTGCPKRDIDTINVDEIQGRVDSIESHLRAMRAALEEKDLEKAEDRFEEAVDTFQNSRMQLAAYPELGLLKSNLREAAGELCYGFVNVNLELFFNHVRRKDVEEARGSLQRSRAEFQRCQKKIRGRADFVALKMNLETAPQALAELENKLNREARLRRIERLQQKLLPRLQAVRHKLESLRKNPNQRELAREIGIAIQEVRTELRPGEGHGDDPDWTAFAARLDADLDALDGRRASLVRRGKVLWAVASLLPPASKSATRAKRAKRPAEALKLIEAAYRAYRQCEEILATVLKEEPHLSKFAFRWRGGKRSVGWLRSHCASSRRAAARMISKLTGKRPKPPRAGARKTKRAAQPEEEPVPKKKTKRRGRIRRW